MILSMRECFVLEGKAVLLAERNPWFSGKVDQLSLQIRPALAASVAELGCPC